MSPWTLPPSSISMTGYYVRSEQVADCDRVGFAEQHDAIAVGMGVRLVDHEDRLAIEVDVLLRQVVDVLRHARFGERIALIPRRLGQPKHEVLVSDERRPWTLRRVRCAEHAERRELGVAARVVQICARADDVADRLGCELLDLGGDAFGEPGAHRIDEHDAVFAGLHGDVALGAAVEHVNVALDRQQV